MAIYLPEKNNIKIISILILMVATYCNVEGQSVKVNCEPITMHGILVEAVELVQANSDSLEGYTTKNSEVNYYFLGSILPDENIDQWIGDQIINYYDSVFVVNSMNASFLGDEYCDVEEKNIRKVYGDAFNGAESFLIKPEKGIYSVKLKKVSAIFNTVVFESTRGTHREFIGGGYDFDKLGNPPLINVLALRSIIQFENIDLIAEEKGLKKVSVRYLDY